MREAEAIRRLDALTNGDQEKAHSEADAILLRFLRLHDFPQIADAYERARERVGFWYA